MICSKVGGDEAGGRGISARTARRKLIGFWSNEVEENALGGLRRYGPLQGLWNVSRRVGPIMQTMNSLEVRESVFSTLRLIGILSAACPIRLVCRFLAASFNLK